MTVVEIKKQYPFLDVVKQVFKGYSNDKKFYAEDVCGQQFLIRVSDVAEFDKKRYEFEILQKICGVGINCSKAIDIRICNESKHVYMLLTWVDGADAREKLPQLSEKLQYQLGIQAGQALQKIHSLPAPCCTEPWTARFNRKTDDRIKRILTCSVKSPHEKAILDFVEGNRYLFFDRPQTVQHGDYHCGNLVITTNNSIGVIDFNRAGYGDPFEEFERSIWDAELSPAFAKGKIDGYFDGKIPEIFFPLMRFYIVSGALASLTWAIEHSDVDLHLRHVDMVMEWYDNLNQVVPIWNEANPKYGLY